MLAVDRQVAEVTETDAEIVCDLAPILPEQSTVGRVEGVNGVHGTGEIHDAVVNQGRGLVGSVSHRPDPLEPQIVHVAPIDLGERAITL